MTPSRPETAPGGLRKVLYVRATEDLVALLDQVVARERAANPGRSVSRADIARELLYEGARRRLVRRLADLDLADRSCWGESIDDPSEYVERVLG